MKLRVLLANTYHFRGGGDSTYTFNLAELLRSRGHEVAFFAMQDRRNIGDPNSDLFVTQIDFRELNRHKTVLAGVKVLGRSVYSIEARRKFRLIVERVRPDVVHLQNIHAHITPSIIFEARQRGVPVVWTLHDYNLVCPNSHFLVDSSGERCEACGSGAYYMAAIRRCKKGSFRASAMSSLEAYAHRMMRVRERVDAFLTPSGFLRDKLLQRGFPARRVHHLPLFVPDETFRAGGDHRGYFLFFGRLEPIKGIRPLLEACRMSPDVRLMMAGQVGEQLAGELADLPPNVEYLGMKFGEELRALVDGAQAVVVPSLWYENQPFSILEAFALGKPVVASDLGGMTELVGDGRRGLLVAPGEARAIAEAMRWMARHPEEARRMGEEGRAYAMQVHGAEPHYAALMRVYKEAIGTVN